MSVLPISLRGWCAKTWRAGNGNVAGQLSMGGTSRRKARKP